MKQLNVFADQQLVGHLMEDKHYQLVFRYAQGWLAKLDATPLSVNLPLTEETYTGDAVTAFFENLLPEGEVLNFISKAAQISQTNIFGFLERFGGDTAGAFSILPEGMLPTGEPHYLPVTPDSIKAWFERSRGIPLDISGEPARMSLSGAQDKMTVFIDGNGNISIPLGPAPSSHIIKPSIQHRQDIPHTAINEALVMTLARRIGLNAAQTRYAPELQAIVIERYDRAIAENGLLIRLHQNDLCQILGIPSGKKYEAEGGPSLKTCFEAVVARSSQPALDKKRLTDWVIFNLLTGNMDGHAKNLSLLTQGNRTKLAPFYDLVCTAVYPNLSRKLAFKIGGENRPKWLMPRHWQRFAEEIGFKPTLIDKTISEMSHRIEAALPEVCSDLKNSVTNTGEQEMLEKVSEYVRVSVEHMKSQK